MVTNLHQNFEIYVFFMKYFWSTHQKARIEKNTIINGCDSLKNSIFITVVRQKYSVFSKNDGKDILNDGKDI